MTEPTIICPNCKTDIKLTESSRDFYMKELAERWSREHDHFKFIK